MSAHGSGRRAKQVGDDRFESGQTNSGRTDAWASERHVIDTADDVLCLHAKNMWHARRKRDEFFDVDIFGEPAWDMLLDLFVAGREGRPVSVSKLCRAAAVPTTTALRMTKAMTEKGMIDREADRNDRRRVLVRLSHDTEERLARFLETQIATVI
jgi:DNA-binding MarR family transcriptional regulator